jgi:hypothetical protein
MPERCDSASSIVMCVVAYSFWRTKSSLINVEIGASHCTPGYLILSLTINDNTAAVKALVVLGMESIVITQMSAWLHEIF